ncbi:MAG: hypothetical protein NVSMB25_13950 [Thermoleophilaceae bacterium]
MSPPAPTYPLGIDRAARRVSIRLGVEGGRHMLVLGASGAGKSNALLWIATRHVLAGFGCVIVDLKGDQEIVERMRYVARCAGREFHQFSLDGGDRWNPLAHGNATELKDKLIGSESFSEPHYKRMYERYLLAVFRVLRSRGDQIDLGQVIPLLHESRLRAALRGVADPALVESVSEYLAGLTASQRSHLSGLADRLSLLVEGESGRYLVPGDDPAAQIDLERALAGGEVVVFSLNASSYPDTASLVGNLVIQDLKTVCGARERAPGERRPGLICIDEFSGLAGDHLAGLFQRARSAWLSVLVATQEIADLRRVGEGFEDQIIGNVELVLAGRQNNPRSAELLAELAGSEETWRSTWHVERRRPLRRARGRVSMQRDEQPIVAADRIKRLAVGEMLLVDKNPQRVEIVLVASIGEAAGRRAGAWRRIA